MKHLINTVIDYHTRNHQAITAKQDQALRDSQNAAQITPLWMLDTISDMHKQAYSKQARIAAFNKRNYGRSGS